jgi:transketolase
MRDLKKRLMDLSFEHKLSHLGSCLTSLPIIQEIYEAKDDDEVFILSNGHAGLAQYVVLEDLYGFDAEGLLEKHGIHPGRDPERKIFCSTGSLGSGLPISVGYALASREKNVYCLISDGECAEGSIWESLRFVKEKNISNLKIYVNVNGFSATEGIDTDYLRRRLLAFLPSIEIRETDSNGYDFLDGVLGHYYVMEEEDYETTFC